VVIAAHPVPQRVERLAVLVRGADGCVRVLRCRRPSGLGLRRRSVGSGSAEAQAKAAATYCGAARHDRQHATGKLLSRAKGLIAVSIVVVPDASPPHATRLRPDLAVRPLFSIPRCTMLRTLIALAAFFLVGCPCAETETNPDAGAYPCTTSADCATFLMWCDLEQGQCVAELDPGADCSADEQCCSHVCVDGVCAEQQPDIPSSC
jgi:hypothetical protein